MCHARISKQATSFLHETNCLQSPASSKTSTNSSELCFHLLPTPGGLSTYQNILGATVKLLFCQEGKRATSELFSLPST